MLTGEKLCNLRKKEGWSQGDLADKLNISRQTVSKWELNESLPDAENIVKISNLFNVSTDYLLKDDAVLTHKTEETPKKKYYTAQGIITTLAGIVTIGIINIIGETYNANHNNFTIYPFRMFVCNYGVDWLVYLGTIATVIGLSMLIRDLYIKKRNRTRLTQKEMKIFAVLTVIISAIAVFLFFLYFEWVLF